jgi:hypothetical protein
MIQVHAIGKKANGSGSVGPRPPQRRVVFEGMTKSIKVNMLNRRRRVMLNLRSVASIQGKVIGLWVRALGIGARVSTPSDLHRIYLQHYGRSTTISQDLDDVHASRMVFMAVHT